MKRESFEKGIGTVLVADPEATSRENSARTLRERGFRVALAANGQEALYKFMLLKPGLVLLDTNLPTFDGFQTCTALRQDPRGKDVPILLIMSANSPEAFSKGYQAGATDFITKPVNWLILAQRTSFILRASKALEELKKSEVGLDDAQRLARMGSWAWDAQSQEVEWSTGLTRLLGLPSEAPHNFDRLLQMIHSEDKAEIEDLLKSAFQTGQNFSRDYRIHSPAGVEIPVHTEVEVTLDNRGAPEQIRGIIQDISQRINSEEKIRYLAYHNKLSGFPNRLFFTESLEKCLAHCALEKRHAAVLFIDIDSLKRINDTFGHQSGDRLILEVAHRLRALVEGFRLATNPVAQSLLLAHSGGGMFLMLIDPLTSAHQFHNKVPQIVHELGKPYNLENRELYVTVSMGCVELPTYGKNTQTIMLNCERALHYAKQLGRNTYQVYSEELVGGSKETLSLESDLRHAIDRGQLEVYFQPKLLIAENRIHSVEALVRWNHPEKGLIGPGQFIPLAENNGLILPIGEWILARSCYFARSWQDLGIEPISVAVNLSGRQFLQQPIVDVIRYALGDAGLEPHFLELEITESVIMQDVERGIGILKRLRDMGIKIAIDDFGTGYSSLAYLKRFPVDVIKIDGSFIKNVVEDPADLAITTAILGMCRQMGLQSVAEFVETKDQLNLLARLDCNYAQGYLIGKPMPPDQLVDFLQRSRTDTSNQPARFRSLGNN